MFTTKTFKLLFCFKKPEVIHLSYIPVLIKDKPVLFVAWDIMNARAVRFIPLRRRYHNNVSAAILAVSKDLREVTLKFANFWRSTTIRISIYAVQLDEATTAQLIHSFRPLNTTVVNTPLVSRIRNLAVIRPISISQRSTSIKKIDRFNTTIKPLSIRVNPFHYHH